MEAKRRRAAYDAVNVEYRRAQRELLEKIELAAFGARRLPSHAEYQAVASLGQRVLHALRDYLDEVGVASAKPLPSERKKLVQRLAELERRWQPSPEDWLKSQPDGAWPTQPPPKPPK